MNTPSATMSCVADANPTIQKNASDAEKKPESGRQNATSPSAAIIVNSMPMTHQRFVRNGSRNGAHTGLSTHGRYICDVYSAMSSLETPRFLKMIAATTPTVTLGRPIAR